MHAGIPLKDRWVTSKFKHQVERQTHQLFALHALHQSLEEMEGVTLTEVEGFLDGCNDVGFDPIRKTPVGEFWSNALAVRDCI